MSPLWDVCKKATDEHPWNTVLICELRYGAGHIRLCLSPLLPRISSNSPWGPTICSVAPAHLHLQLHLLDSIHIGPLWGFHVSHMQDTAQRALLLFNRLPPLPPPRPLLKYHLLWTALDDNPVCTHHYNWMLSHLFHHIHPTIIYCCVSILLVWFPHWTAGFRKAASLSMPRTVTVTQQGLNRYLLNESMNVQVWRIHMMMIFKSSHLPSFFHNIITFPVSKLSQASLCPENNNFTVHTKDDSLWESLVSIN